MMVMTRTRRTSKQAPVKGTQTKTSQKKFISFSLLVSAGIKERQERGKVLQALTAGVTAGPGGATWGPSKQRDPSGSERGWQEL